MADSSPGAGRTIRRVVWLVLFCVSLPAGAQAPAPPPDPLLPTVSPPPSPADVLDHPVDALELRLEAVSALEERAASLRGDMCGVAADSGKASDACRLAGQALRAIAHVRERVQRQLTAARVELEVEILRARDRKGLRSRTSHSCSLESYAPGPSDPLKVVRLHFIFPQIDRLSPGNFARTHDGLGDRAMNGHKFAAEWIRHHNELLAAGNTPQDGVIPPPPALPLGFRFRFGGVRNPNVPDDPATLQKYFFYNWDASNKNSRNSIAGNPYLKPALSSAAINVVFASQLGAQGWVPGHPVLDAGTMMPVFGTLNPRWVPFLFPHFQLIGDAWANSLVPSSVPAHIAMPSYWLGHLLRQRYWNQDQQMTGEYAPFEGPFGVWWRDRQFQHEVGHILGLHHTWLDHNRLGDGTIETCDDYLICCQPGTPKNPSIQYNNVMDYNADQRAWSPCQLSIAHFNLLNHRRGVLYLPCTADAAYDTEIPAHATVTWDAPHELAGNLVLRAGSRLEVECGVTIAHDAKILKEPGSQILGENLIVRRPKCPPIDISL